MFSVLAGCRFPVAGLVAYLWQFNYTVCRSQYVYLYRYVHIICILYIYIYIYIYIYLYTTKWINKTITKHIWKHAYACLWVHHKEINTLKTNVCMHRYIHTYICKLSLTPHLELDDIRLILLLSCGLFQ